MGIFARTNGEAMDQLKYPFCINRFAREVHVPVPARCKMEEKKNQHENNL